MTNLSPESDPSVGQLLPVDITARGRDENEGEGYALSSFQVRRADAPEVTDPFVSVIVTEEFNEGRTSFRVNGPMQYEDYAVLGEGLTVNDGHRYSELDLTHYGELSEKGRETVLRTLGSLIFMLSKAEE